MQAGRRAEISVAQGLQSHVLAVVAPRSSSLPMGSSTSKPTEPSVAQKVRRAFAPRRRKPEQGKENDSDSRSVAGSFHLSTKSFPLEVIRSSASSPPKVLFEPSSSCSSAPTPDDARPLPPPPPPKSVPEPDPALPAHSDPRPHPPTLPAALSSGPSHATSNRSSIIPMSPGMESALTYITISEQLQAQQPAPSPPPLPSRLAHPSPVPIQPSSDVSLLSGKPIIQGPSRPQESERTHQQPDVEELKRIERPRAKSESEGLLLERDHTNKRNSDSTISHYTIRPGAGGPRSSRPTSMAESFQSTYTIVPGGGCANSGVVMANKRVSLVDPDLGSLEEDDDSFKSLDDLDGQMSSLVLAMGQERLSSPLLKPKRRSMSLNIGVSGSNSSITQAHQPPPNTSAAELKQPSYSISEGFYNHPSTDSSSLALSHSNQTQPWTPQRPQSNRNQKLPAVPPSYNPNTTFTYPVQRPSPNHPAPPASFRQTAVSFTSSLAPAAGFARKAVERVKGALGHMGHHGGSHSGSISSMSISSASGCSSSASVSSAAPSSFPGEWGVLNLTRTPSNQSSATHATHSSNMHAVNVKEVKERSERERQQQAAAEKKRMKKMRRTPNGQSGGTYSIGSISTASGSDSDALMSSGVVFGPLLRGPLRNRNGLPAASGVVFGRELSKCVRDTAVWVGKECVDARKENTGKELMGRPELSVYERRMLPAVVVRCAQHLLIWGIQEEGLFRVPGRAAHIAKLRSEYDTGVDYDMSGCAPSDLDPHAVASIFKAYLRELPEHILTQKLSAYFDIAIEQESTSTAAADLQTPQWGMRKGPGLPSNQKPSQNNAMGSIASPVSSASPTSAFPAPNLRKPPSLSTFAMPSFSGMRPASQNLISALRSLIAKLPRENRDLLRTVVELVRATAKESKMTKMPLSNLVMVFLPSLNISTQLFRVLCEDERVWTGLVDVGDREQDQQDESEPTEEDVEEDAVLDLRRNTVILDIRRDFDDQQKDDESSSMNETEEGDEDDEDQDDAHRRWTVVKRPEIPTVYLDSRSQASSTSLASSVLASSSREVSTVESSALHDDMSSISASTPDDTEGILSSSAESVMTPLTPSAQSSAAYLPLDALETVKDLSGRGDDTAPVNAVGPRIQVVEPDSMGSEIGVEEGQVRRLTISNPLPASPHVIISSEKNLPQTPISPKRRSIPGLSFPSLSAFGHRSSRSSSGSEPVSPAESLSSDKAHGGKSQPGSGLRTKKPSLKLLFSKKSAGSLGSGSKDIVVVNSPSSAPGSTPSSVSSSSYVSTQLRTASMILTGEGVGGCDGSGSSDSSVSTPVSVVTCPGTATNSAGGIASRASSSMLDLPPALEASFEEGPSLRRELGLEESPPGTATPPKRQKKRVKTMVGQTPIADWYGSVSAASSVNDLRSSGDAAGEGSNDEKDYDVVARRRTVMGRGRVASMSSQLSMNHLGLEDTELGAEEDWTKSVLLAADVEFGLGRKP